MKRDCGKGELIPTAWLVVSCTGIADHEAELSFTTRAEAEISFHEILQQLVPYSNVRLYARDKQGYENCMKHSSMDKKGKLSHMCYHHE